MDDARWAIIDQRTGARWTDRLYSTQRSAEAAIWLYGMHRGVVSTTQSDPANVAKNLPDYDITRFTVQES